ncbi:2-succinyl-5-enolpyruvyl-6-hydroxy-3-cyclohexene-1-carboxylic-acid synthase [Roseivirga sp.]|uniref:2-succinyl-5-enolpyruvyl-6-hydroxy-3- cyclohexene-1-carboxylic-acid synthase n=1 Tax=Roseivirga sp. TaxID=1964215 RepID=UPI003B529072
MILPHINEIASLCAAHGIKQAIVSPGSRSAAISLAFENHPEIDVKVVADERSAAFIGMGIALQKQEAVALICTSGSAAFNYAPAIAEAYYQEIPLLVITADRPPEWVNQYDGQTIQQEDIYGKHVKAAFNLPVDLSHSDAQWHANRLVNEAILATRSFPKGPVHLNVPLREPFYPGEDDKFEYPKVRKIESLEAEKTLSEANWNELLGLWKSFSNRLIVVGQSNPDTELSQALADLAQKTGTPIINEITANQHGIENVITKQDVFLQGQPKLEAPELLITLGNSLISKNLKEFLRKNPTKAHWHIRQGSRLNDSLRQVTHVIDQKPAQFIQTLTTLVSESDTSAFGEAWSSLGREVEKKAQDFLHQATFGEFKAVQTCLNQLPTQGQLHLANSMSVRYANFIGLRQNEVSVYCNRGTSGIDGSNSTAVGAALSTDDMVTLITGDMAFLYDRNAFWHPYDLNNLRIIVMNNAGGGIFGMIKGPRSLASYEKLFQTNQPITAKLTAKEFGFEYATAKNDDQLNDELKSFFNPSSSAKILEVFSDPKVNEKVLADFKAYCLGL